MTTRQKVLLVLFIVLPLIAGIILSIIGTDSFGEKRNVFSGVGPKKIGLISLENVIMSSSDCVRQFKDFADDKSIAGILFHIDSPGGAVAPSQEIYEEVVKFKHTGKPIVVSMGNLAASGGYYAACPATKIFANPGTITGSIGVIFQFPQYFKLMDKVGVNMVTMKSGLYKDAGNPGREMTEDEKQLLQNLIDQTHEQFISAVAVSRHIPIDTLRNFADGRIFNGEQALEVNLVDTLGSYEDALAYLKHICKLPSDASVESGSSGAGNLKDLLTESLSNLFPMLKRAGVKPGVYFMTDLF